MINWILNLDDSDGIAFLSFVANALTLLLGYIAYDRFLKRKAHEKQLDVVLDLLECIHNSKNRIEVFSVAYENGLRTILEESIFEMIEDPTFNNREDSLYFYYPEDNALNWDFYTKFHANPLLPKGIAAKLKLLSIRNKFVYTRSLVFNRNGMIIGNYNNPIPDTRIFYVAQFHTSLNTAGEFKTAVINLKQSILKWLQEYGIEDVNLVDKYG